MIEIKSNLVAGFRKTMNTTGLNSAGIEQIERTEKIRLETPLRAKMEGVNFARQASGGRQSNQTK